MLRLLLAKGVLRRRRGWWHLRLSTDLQHLGRDLQVSGGRLRVAVSIDRDLQASGRSQCLVESVASLCAQPTPLTKASGQAINTHSRGVTAVAGGGRGGHRGPRRGRGGPLGSEEACAADEPATPAVAHAFLGPGGCLDTARGVYQRQRA